MGTAAVFLDRDGVINRNVFYQSSGEWESPRTTADLALHPGAAEAIVLLNKAGLPVFIVSNQPSFAKGKTSLEELKAVDAEIIRLLAEEGASITERFYAYDHPDFPDASVPGPKGARKPSPYFLIEAAKKYDLDLTHCWMVGDRDADIECGGAAGTRTILIASDHTGAKTGAVTPNYHADSLSHAVVSVILGKMA